VLPGGLVLRAGYIGTLGHASLPENANCRTCERGPSVYDIRHNRVLSSVYDLPSGPGERLLDKGSGGAKILGGWHLSGIQAIHTSNPLTGTVDCDSSSLLDGNSHSDHRPYALRTLADLLDALDGSVRSYGGDSFPLK
jgi:hypothetical protein